MKTKVHLWGEWVLNKKLAIVPWRCWDKEADYIIWMKWVFRIPKHPQVIHKRLSQTRHVRKASLNGIK